MIGHLPLEDGVKAFKLVTYGIHLPCQKKGCRGDYNFTGQAQPGLVANTQKLIHRCSVCGDVGRLDRAYPYTVQQAEGQPLPADLQSALDHASIPTLLVIK